MVQQTMLFQCWSINSDETFREGEMLKLNGEIEE